MPVYTDMTGRHVQVSNVPKRIISIVPSQTELLYYLGLDEEVVGITKFCVHPGLWFRTKKRVGGTKKLHIDEIRASKPDLIIANKEENTKEQVEELAAEFPTWVSDIRNIKEALQMMVSVGEMVGRKENAEQLADKVKVGFAGIHRMGGKKRVAYFIWREPWMSVGGDTFISNMIEKIGWENVFAGKTRYPEINAQELATCGAELILLSSEPYPFKEKHITEIQELAPDAKIILVDGEMFSWYGSRMLEAIPYFQQMIAGR